MRSSTSCLRRCNPSALALYSITLVALCFLPPNATIPLRVASTTYIFFYFLNVRRRRCRHCARFVRRRAAHNFLLVRFACSKTNAPRRSTIYSNIASPAAARLYRHAHIIVESQPSGVRARFKNTQFSNRYKKKTTNENRRAYTFNTFA